MHLFYVDFACFRLFLQSAFGGLFEEKLFISSRIFMKVYSFIYGCLERMDFVYPTLFSSALLLPLHRQHRHCLWRSLFFIVWETPFVKNGLFLIICRVRREVFSSVKI